MGKEETVKPIAYTKNDFSGDKTELDIKDENGLPAKVLLLKNDRIGIVRTGNGNDVELATEEAGQDKRKYLSAIIARTTEIDGVQQIMDDMGKLPMGDYFKIQGAFSELNF